MITALTLLQDQLKKAHELLESTMADVTDEHLHADPGGKAFPVGSLYAHLVFSEDVIVNTMMQGKPSLSETTMKDHTGTDTPMPAMDENWSANNEQWSKSVQIDLPKLRAYAQAVYAATDAYVASLSDADLEKEIDLGSWGKHTVADLLANFVVGHANSLAGEISAVKGVHGAQGYPF